MQSFMPEIVRGGDCQNGEQQVIKHVRFALLLAILFYLALAS